MGKFRHENSRCKDTCLETVCRGNVKNVRWIHDPQQRFKILSCDVANIEFDVAFGIRRCAVPNSQQWVILSRTHLRMFELVYRRIELLLLHLYTRDIRYEERQS